MAESVTITAHTGRGEDKVEAGTREVQKPDDLSEMIDLWGEAMVYKRSWGSFVIEVQSQIRSGKSPEQEAHDLYSRYPHLKPEGYVPPTGVKV